MFSFMISTDSACDILLGELNKSNVFCVPMQYLIMDTVYDGQCTKESEFRVFYDIIRKGTLPTTTQINATVLEEYFTNLFNTQPGDIIHISLSSGFSNTYNNAVSAAKAVCEKFPGRKIYVCDSLSATRAQAVLVDYCVKARIKGKTALETYQSLCKLIPCVRVFVLPRDLFHLQRGGRLSKASALVGSLLQIKPTIEFNAIGSLSVIGKTKGWTKGLNELASRAIKVATNPKTDGIYIAHGDCYEDAKELKELIQAKIDAPVNIGWIGPVIGTHTGPGTIGLAVVGDPRKK